MTLTLPTTPKSPLRQRLIEDMTMRRFAMATQRGYKWMADHARVRHVDRHSQRDSRRVDCLSRRYALTVSN